MLTFNVEDNHLDYLEVENGFIGVLVTDDEEIVACTIFTYKTEYEAKMAMDMLVRAAFASDKFFEEN